MRYFFNLDKAYNREQALINGEYAPPIVLTAETPEIIDGIRDYLQGGLPL